MAIYNLSAIGNGITLDTIDLTWTNTGPGGSGDYDTVKVYYWHGGAWVLWVTLAGSATSKSGFSTLDNTAYDLRVRGEATRVDNSDYAYGVGNFGDTQSEAVSGSDSSGEDIGYSDTDTETVSASGSGGEVSTSSDTAIEYVFASDTTGGAAVSPLSTTFRYYFGSFDGKIYYEDKDVMNDDGTAIDAIWESKDLDFGDMFSEMNDRKKNIRRVRLNYVDKTDATDIDVGVSIDGGVTWTTRSKALGNGDGKSKDADFFFNLTNPYFRFRVRSNSTTDKFQWTRLTPWFCDAGDAF